MHPWYVVVGNGCFSVYPDNGAYIASMIPRHTTLPYGVLSSLENKQIMSCSCGGAMIMSDEYN